MSFYHRPHPHVDIPPGARPAEIPSPITSWSPYMFQVDPPPEGSPYSTYSAWSDTREPSYYNQPRSPPPPGTHGAYAHPSPQSIHASLLWGGAHRSRSNPRPDVSRAVSRSTSASATNVNAQAGIGAHPIAASRTHRSVRSESSGSGSWSPAGSVSIHSPRMGPLTNLSPGSVAPSPHNSFASLSELSSELHSMSEDASSAHAATAEVRLSDEKLQTDEGLAHFQAGDLPKQDDEWHRLIPPAAMETLHKKEVKRQSQIFEFIKSERDYVRDLRLLMDYFMEPLRVASPPIIHKDRLRGFIKEVFWNMEDICMFHERMLKALFQRQREQHPLVQGISDIILKTCLEFGDAYETYFKHYPLSKGRHLSEMNRNGDYNYFIRQRLQDPRTRKRDFTAFLIQPTSRLSHFRLQLKGVQETTQELYAIEGHSDLDQLELVQDILNSVIRTSQPGIDVSDSKAKFWDLCESLVYRKGEIIDMDLYDQSRTLIYSGPLVRRQRSELDWHGWHDMHVALLDNYLIITKEDAHHQSGLLRRHVVSKPIPLEYLRLGSFVDPPETRKVKDPDRAMFKSLLGESKPMFPLTIYHASNKSSRRYTLFAGSENERKKWKKELQEGMTLRRVNQESNMWFAPHVINEGFFRGSGSKVQSLLSGKITCATAFSLNSRQYIVVGCASGIYIATRGASTFQKLIPFNSPSAMATLPEYGKVIVQHNGHLMAYPVDSLAEAASGEQAAVTKLRESGSQITGQEGGSVLFFRAGKVGNRTMIMYAAKKSLSQVALYALEMVSPSPNVRPENAGPAFRSFGPPLNMPKDVHDLSPLAKMVAVCGEKGMLIVDPTSLSSSAMTVVPDFRSSASSEPMTALKVRCDQARVLGLVRCDANELLVIFDELGCYVTKHGVPSRSSGYIRWESKATAFAQRGSHTLLFSSNFIEIRNTQTGRLVQVIEGRDVRLLHAGMTENDALLVAMETLPGDGQQGSNEKIVELIQTADLRTPATGGVDGAWDEWDMAA